MQVTILTKFNIGDKVTFKVGEDTREYFGLVRNIHYFVSNEKQELRYLLEPALINPKNNDEKAFVMQMNTYLLNRYFVEEELTISNN